MDSYRLVVMLFERLIRNCMEGAQPDAERRREPHLRAVPPVTPNKDDGRLLKGRFYRAFAQDIQNQRGVYKQTKMFNRQRQCLCDACT